MNVRSSRFLRPYKPGLKSLEEMRLSRICRAMRQAAISGSVFHLWWHPHNFGADIAENMAFLRRILESYRQLADEYGMTSATIAETADAWEIGRASCRERVCKYVYISVVAGSLQKNKRPINTQNKH